MDWNNLTGQRFRFQGTLDEMKIVEVKINKSKSYRIIKKYIFIFKNIEEMSTNTTFRNHVHIEVTPALYKRIYQQESVNLQADFEFTAEVYRYNKHALVEDKMNARKFQLGLKDLNKLNKIERATK